MKLIEHSTSDTLAEINKEMKKKWKKENISTQLSKTPKSNRKINFTMEGIPCFFFIEVDYILVVLTGNTWSDNLLNAALDYMLAVSKAFNISIIQLFLDYQCEPDQPLIEKGYGFQKASMEDENFASLHHLLKLHSVDRRCSYYLDVTKRAIESIPLLEVIEQKVKQLQMDYPAFEYQRKNIVNGSLYFFTYYYRGHEGYFELSHNGSSFQLEDKTTHFCKTVSNAEEMKTICEELFEEAYTYARLKNLITPTKKHFIHCMWDSHRIKKEISSQMFDFLNQRLDAEWIEENILTRKGFYEDVDGIRIVGVFDYIFVISIFDFNEVHCFPLEKMKEAENKMMELAIMRRETEVKRKTSIFQKKLLR